jgi:hypothetical protein
VVPTSDQPACELVETAAGRLIILPIAGELISASESVDVVGTALSYDASWVGIPHERLGDDFFRLRTGVAGEIAQRFVNYRIGLAVIGDITQLTERSPTLRDLVRESNAGRQLWFVSDRAELEARLGGGTS